MKTFAAILGAFFIIASTALIPAVSFAACTSITVTLSYGSSGTQVTALQAILRAQGFFSAAFVPHFGAATRTAVRAFQKAHGISQTGTVGPQTRAALNAAGCSSSGAASSGSASAPASGSFEVTGWLPYWRISSSTLDVVPHMNEVTEINPFVYTLKSDGTVLDNTPAGQSWTPVITAARAQNVRVIPTVMTGNGDLIHTLLSNSTKRQMLEDRIAAVVSDNNFDGIDIDFEGKHAEDKNYFSTFLKGLSQRLGSKFLMCTIESRTPIDARYYGTDAPVDASVYANDLIAINTYCDRVRIMTYDQQGIDQSLATSAASSSQLYAPVADPRWVQKVVALMSQSISKNKMLIGIPTYGYEYDVTAYANNQYNYDILWTFNPGYAWQIAQQYGITPQRNAAGEMFFSYQPTASSTAPLSGVNALMAATAATAFADSANQHMNFRLIDWPDAQSIAGKVELAENLGVRGVSIFKLDGGEDPAIWTALLGVKQ